MSGLVVSPIDKWFMGPVPRFSPQDLGVPGDKHDLSSAMQRARDMINNPEQMSWQTVCLLPSGGTQSESCFFPLNSIERQTKRPLAFGSEPRFIDPGVSNAMSEDLL